MENGGHNAIRLSSRAERRLVCGLASAACQMEGRRYRPAERLRRDNRRLGEDMCWL